MVTGFCNLRVVIRIQMPFTESCKQLGREYRLQQSHWQILLLHRVHSAGHIGERCALSDFYRQSCMHCLSETEEKLGFVIGRPVWV